MVLKSKALPALRGDAVSPLAAYEEKKQRNFTRGALDSPFPCCTPGALVRCSPSLEDPAGAGPQESSRTGCGGTRSPLPSLAALC